MYNYLISSYITILSAHMVFSRKSVNKMMHSVLSYYHTVKYFPLECSKGYFGSDCSTKCIFPNYGEDCQYYCKCIQHKCHFSYGCLKKTATFNQYQISSMYRSRIVNLKGIVFVVQF